MDSVVEKAWIDGVFRRGRVGIDADDLDTVFEPFYSTKETGRGTGLGLYVSKDIIESFSGTIRMENNEHGGATVVIELPQCDKFSEAVRA